MDGFTIWAFFMATWYIWVIGVIALLLLVYLNANFPRVRRTGKLDRVVEKKTWYGKKYYLWDVRLTGGWYLVVKNKASLLGRKSQQRVEELQAQVVWGKNYEYDLVGVSFAYLKANVTGVRVKAH